MVGLSHEDIRGIVRKHGDLRDRLMFVADFCAGCALGDIAQIGAGRGGATTGLAAVARKRGRRVVVVEPWLVGVEGCQEEDRDIFWGAVMPFRDIILRWENVSQAPSVTEEMRKLILCFAYVDGLRTYPAVLTDLITVSHAAVIAIRRDGLEYAVRLFGELMNRAVLQEGNKEEVYLL